MSYNDREDKPEVYYIPPNYEDAGGFLGGRFKQRNGIEMAVVGGPLLLININFIMPRVSTEVGLSILIVSVLPALALCAFGIRGESISQFLFAFIKYLKKRRKLSFIHFYDGTHIDAKKLTQDEPEEELDEPIEEMTEEPATQEPEKKKRTRRKHNMPEQPHILNSAMKEMLLRKLELGDDDGEYGDI